MLVALIRALQDGLGVVTYIALESHASIHGEEQDDVAASVERFGEQGLVLFLGGPDAVLHCLYDVVVVPAFDHEIPDACSVRVLG